MNLSIKILLAFSLFAGSSLCADEKDSARHRFSGLMFGDVYYVAKHHDEAVEGANGFWFRRIYFTYDQDLDDEFGVRFRIELNSPGDFTTRAKLEPFLKDGYLKWTRGNHAIIIGLSSVPFWGYIEKLWGYRSIEKTMADLFKLGSSRDLGIALKGKLGASKRIFYHAQLGTGSGTRSETNQGKKVAFAVGQKLTERLTVEIYGDFEERPGRADRYTAQGFLSYETPKFRFGVQFLHQTRQQGVGEEEIEMLSLFGTARLSKRVWGYFRFDRAFDALSDAPSISYLPVADATKFNFLLAGLDFQPHKLVHFMPNVELLIYDSVNGVTPDTDVIPRLTVFYQWK